MPSPNNLLPPTTYLARFLTHFLRFFAAISDAYTNHYDYICAMIRKICVAATVAAAIAMPSLSFGGGENRATSQGDTVTVNNHEDLRCRLQAIADSAAGQVGIAVISPEGDTLTVNNTADYQLMSVFKLHEALAVAHVLDQQGVGLDTVMPIHRAELNPNTWSPMYTDHTEDPIELPMRELLRYILQESDNNVSNLLFDRIISVGDCDSFIRAATGIDGFKLTYTEHQMQLDHSLSGGNVTTPLAAARLIDKVFADSIVSPAKQAEIQQILLDCKTGTDRIYAPLAGHNGVTLAHKTGSGYRDGDGLLTAHNDIGRILLPDGRTYALAVFVKDFDGTAAQASEVIASISDAVYKAFAAVSGGDGL